MREARAGLGAKQTGGPISILDALCESAPASMLAGHDPIATDGDHITPKPSDA